MHPTGAPRSPGNHSAGSRVDHPPAAPAGSNARNAYDLDIMCRTLGQLAPAEGTNNIALRNY